MARIRTIKPAFWTDERMVELSITERLFYIGTWNFADDNGNLERSSKTLKMQIFPAETFDCEPLIQALIKAGRMVEYSVNGKTYLHIQEFQKNQVINRRSKSLIPGISESVIYRDEETCDSVSDDGTLDDDSVSDDGTLDDDSVSDDTVDEQDSVIAHGALTEHSLREGKGREGSKHSSPSTGDPAPFGFARFWAAWPSTDRKTAKAKCLDVWRKRKLEPLADDIVRHVESLKPSKAWRDGFEPAPLTYLNQRRWEDGEPTQQGADDMWAGAL